MSDNTLASLIRDVSPHPAAVRLTGKTITGMPSGVHTGGAWLWNDEVWKPLDGRPWVNCEYHVPTNELTILFEMAEKNVPLFPKNWRVETVNDRRFIVRPRSMIFPDEISSEDLIDWDFDDAEGVDGLTYIENAIRTVNRHGWYIGEDISLALDPAGNWFLYDLSNAQCCNNGNLTDECAWDRFVEVVSPARYKLKQNAREARDLLALTSEPTFFGSHVYASFARPLGCWARVPNMHQIVHESTPSWQAQKPHSWLMTSEFLNPNLVKSYELRLAYVSWS